jgi:hypothetical protein
VLDVKRQAVDIGYGDRRKGWMVTWENGPFEWAIIGTLGGAIWAEELGVYPYAIGHTETFKFVQRSRWVAEAKNSYAVVFYPQS